MAGVNIHSHSAVSSLGRRGGEQSEKVATGRPPVQIGGARVVVRSGGTSDQGIPAENQPNTNAADATEGVLPGLGRLRLDALLRELVDRARDVIVSEDRLHQLLDAVDGVAGELSLRDVL